MTLIDQPGNPTLKIEVPKQGGTSIRYVPWHAVLVVIETTEEHVRDVLTERIRLALDADAPAADAAAMERLAQYDDEDTDIDPFYIAALFGLADQLQLTEAQRSLLVAAVIPLLKVMESTTFEVLAEEPNQPFLVLDTGETQTRAQARAHIINELHRLEDAGITVGDEQFLASLEQGIEAGLFAQTPLIAKLVKEIRRIQR